MEEAKKKRRLAKGQFTRIEGKLLSTIDNLDEWTLNNRYSDLKERWNAAQNAHDDYVLTLADDEATTEESWVAELYDRFDSLEIAIGKRLKIVKGEHEAKTEAQHQYSTPSRQQREPSNAIRMEKLKFQSFNGDIRKFPEFLKEFKQHIEPYSNEKQLAYVLKSYLADSVKEEVSNVSDDYDKMWERLTEKYGDVGNLVDAILVDIKKLSLRGDNPTHVLKMINVIEKAYRDLENLGEETELFNSTTISIVEQAMPSDMKKEWVKLIASKRFSSKQNFKALLEFLSDMRRRLEYMGASIREAEDFGSAQQGRSYHVGEEAQHHERIQGKRGSEPQHQQYERRQDRKGCWIHKFEGDVPDHPIWRCRLFLSKSTQERINLVVENKACQRCLEQECPGSVDPSRCVLKFNCLWPGCGADHNKLLHITAAKVHHSLDGEYERQPGGSDNTMLPIQPL